MWPIKKNMHTLLRSKNYSDLKFNKYSYIYIYILKGTFQKTFKNKFYMNFGPTQHLSEASHFYNT